jgi:acyl carrier protein phosphodiesterase
VNYLAHALLAGPDEEHRLGGLLGDFVKGPLSSVPPQFSDAVVDGLVLHRRIDSFADAHPAFARSRRRISNERRRYSGIIIDMFYDHFLALHWARYSAQPLESFTAAVYALLARRPLPARLAEILPTMCQEDWLAGYRDPLAVIRALDQIAARRLKRNNNLAGAGGELAASYRAFEDDFLDFFPAAMAFAGRFLESAGTAHSRARQALGVDLSAARRPSSG